MVSEGRQIERYAIEITDGVNALPVRAVPDFDGVVLMRGSRAEGQKQARDEWRVASCEWRVAIGEWRVAWDEATRT